MNIMTGGITTDGSSVWGTRYPFHPYPTGWFMVGFSEDVAPKQVKPLRYFARDLVLFRTEAGQPVVADAHCPHLGAHLGYDSKVEGDTIVCPFHAWRYDMTGKCVEIPFTKAIPPQARIRVWPTVERSGIIFAWHDLDGREPSWQLPDYDETTRRENTGFHRLHDDFGGAHPQDIFENAVDFAHFPGVHSTGRAMSAGELQIDGPLFLSPIKMYSADETRPLSEATPMSYAMAEVVGGGLARVASSSPMMPGITNISWVGATPVDEKLTHYRVSFFMLIAPDCPLSGEQIDQIDQAMTPVNRAEQYSDGKIWPHKAYVHRPMLSAVDGPILKYREWYKQFHPRPVAE